MANILSRCALSALVLFSFYCSCGCGTSRGIFDVRAIAGIGTALALASAVTCAVGAFEHSLNPTLHHHVALVIQPVAMAAKSNPEEGRRLLRAGLRPRAKNPRARGCRRLLGEALESRVRGSRELMYGFEGAALLRGIWMNWIAFARCNRIFNNPWVLTRRTGPVVGFLNVVSFRDLNKCCAH